MVSRQNGQRQQATYEQLLTDDPSGMAMLDQALEGASTEEVARVRVDREVLQPAPTEARNELNRGVGSPELVELWRSS